MARKKGSRCISEARTKAIHDMSCNGVRICDIAVFYNIRGSNTSDVIRCLHNALPVHTRKMGFKARLNERGMRLFRKCVLENGFEALYIILAWFKVVTGVSLSEKTRQKYIRKLQMQSYIEIQKPYLYKNNLSARIVWARTHEHWKQEQWSKVMFTDESSFSVCPIKNWLRVWRH